MKQIIICSQKTSIPDLKEKLAQREKELGPQKLAHLLILKQIIAARISHEKYGIPKDMAYFDKLQYLRKQLRETRVR